MQRAGIARGHEQVRYLLVKERLDVEGFHHITVELRVQAGIPDALV